jgi:riboflavin synthase
MTKLQVSVSDHAVLRYLERAGGFEIERLRGELQARVQRLVVPGAASVVIDGMRFVTRKGADGIIVVTVLEMDRQIGVRPDPGAR